MVAGAFAVTFVGFGSAYTFSAFLKKYSPDNMEPNAAITATATFRITGDVEQGTGASGS